MSAQSQTLAPRAAAPGLAVWFGWVLTGLAALTPLMAWLGPLGFAPLLGLAGLLCLPALRGGPRAPAVAIVLLLGLAWAALSSLWSPFHPGEIGESVAVKLAAQLVLYWAAWEAALQADEGGRRRALRVFAWGLAGYGLLLLVEALTGGAIYMSLREAIGDPIRPDLGRKNLAQGSFVLALLWPVAAAAGLRAGAPAWTALPMALGAAALSRLFLSDAPYLSVGLAVAVGLAVWAWPRVAPRVLGLGAAVGLLLMPVMVLLVLLSDLDRRLPESWRQRVAYWAYAIERIADHPWRGWGLDASRTFSPHIQLHPHNGAVQVWLELGAVGAAVAGVLWACLFRGLAREGRRLVAAGLAASMAVYLFFGLVSFGVWQEWWLALGALVAVIGALGGVGLDPARPRPIDAEGQSR